MYKTAVSQLALISTIAYSAFKGCCTLNIIFLTTSCLKNSTTHHEPSCHHIIDMMACKQIENKASLNSAGYLRNSNGVFIVAVFTKKLYSYYKLHCLHLEYLNYVFCKLINFAFTEFCMYLMV